VEGNNIAMDVKKVGIYLNKFES